MRTKHHDEKKQEPRVRAGCSTKIVFIFPFVLLSYIVQGYKSVESNPVSAGTYTHTVIIIQRDSTIFAHLYQWLRSFPALVSACAVHIVYSAVHYKQRNSAHRFFNIVIIINSLRRLVSIGSCTMDRSCQGKKEIRNKRSQSKDKERDSLAVRHMGHAFLARGKRK